MSYDFGFIITRHVNSEQTNRYWNQSVKLIRTMYPHRKIVIIDDNSNSAFLKADFQYKNLTIVQSEYPGRGELLPYYYYSKNKWFDRAVIIHDSVFIHNRIPFETFNMPVMPLWHFSSNSLDNVANNIRIARTLSHGSQLVPYLNSKNTALLHKWNGCFGTQSFITHDFLTSITNKYNLHNLVNVVHNRTDRCSLERIFGLIFGLEYSKLVAVKSAFGDICSTPMAYGYSYNEYINLLRGQNKVIKKIVKVWTGR